MRSWITVPACIISLQASAAGAASYMLKDQSDLVGALDRIESRSDDTLMDIARRYGLGLDEIERANPGVDILMPGEATQIMLPTAFLLPDASRDGIVLNLAEMRLYFYPPAVSSPSLDHALLDHALLDHALLDQGTLDQARLEQPPLEPTFPDNTAPGDAAPAPPPSRESESSAENVNKTPGTTDSALPASWAPRVLTFPVGIGQEGWRTPLGNTEIVDKITDPSWTPPASVRNAYLAEGIELPDRIPPGPDNPLGGYALRLKPHSYLLHGTNKPDGVGTRVSHGCIRLFPEDIETLFDQVEIGTPVQIVDQPYKAGWHQERLYLEVHSPAYRDETHSNWTPLIHAIIKATADRPANIDWQRVESIRKAADGLPHPIDLPHPNDLPHPIDRPGVADALATGSPARL